jgi:hypothetical protein
MQPILSHGTELALKGEYITDGAVLFLRGTDQAFEQR